jgi:sulfite exporter TauE/SafE
MSAVIISGLVMGFGASTGCMAGCVPLLLPFTAAAEQPSALKGLYASLAFSLGRMAAYAGLLTAIIILRGIIDIDIKIEAVAILFSGAILIVSGLASLGVFHGNHVLNRMLCQHISAGRSPFYLGVLTGIRPCGPLLAALIFAITLPNTAGMVLFLFFFWLASSVLIMGIGVAGGSLGTVLARKIGLERTRRIASLTMIVIGIFFIIQAIGLLINSNLTMIPA